MDVRESEVRKPEPVADKPAGAGVSIMTPKQTGPSRSPTSW